MSELKIMSYVLLADDPSRVSRPLAEDAVLAKVLGSLMFQLSLPHTNRDGLRLFVRMSDGSLRRHPLDVYSSYGELLEWANEVLLQSDWAPDNPDVDTPTSDTEISVAAA